jgi:ATP-dependent Clp protease adaptor protein ClpS
MSTTTPTAPPAAEPLRRELPSTRPKEETKPHRQPPYAVILHNDDVNGFDHVIGVLRKVFNYGFLKAFWLTAKAHFRGKAVVWSGSLEVAELKADQVRSCGPDPNMKARGATTLAVTVEPMA